MIGYLCKKQNAGSNPVRSFGLVDEWPKSVWVKAQGRKP